MNIFNFLVFSSIGGLPYDIDDISSSTDYSLISNISCVSTENKLSDCTVNKVNQCMKYCQTALGLNCYSKYKSVSIHLVYSCDHYC